MKIENLSKTNNGPTKIIIRSDSEGFEFQVTYIRLTGYTTLIILSQQALILLQFPQHALVSIQCGIDGIVWHSGLMIFSCLSYLQPTCQWPLPNYMYDYKLTLCVYYTDYVCRLRFYYIRLVTYIGTFLVGIIL